MKNKLIIESYSQTLFKEVVSTEVPAGMMLIEGVLGRVDSMNRNKRYYTREEYVKHVADLNQRINESNGVLGELEHPKSMSIDLNNVSHKVISCRVDEDGFVRGQVLLLDTPKGKIAQSVIRSKSPLPISSRAIGQVNENGSVQLKHLATYDLVGTSGFAEASMQKALTESVKDSDGKLVMESYEFDIDSNGNIISESSESSNAQMLFESLSQEERKEFLGLIVSEGKITTTDANTAVDNFENDIDKNNDKADKSQPVVTDTETSLDVTMMESKINEMIDARMVEFYGPLFEKWVKSEYTPHIAESIQNWVTGEFAPVLESWVTGEFAPVLESWVTGEFAPVLESWVTSEFAPVLESWVTGEFAPVLESWVTGEYSSEVKNLISEELSSENSEALTQRILESINTESVLESLKNYVNKDYTSKLESWITENFAQKGTTELVNENGNAAISNGSTVKEFTGENSEAKMFSSKILDQIEASIASATNIEEDKPAIADLSNVVDESHFMFAPNWLKNIPAEYKSIWTSMNESQREEVQRRAAVRLLITESDIYSFWNGINFQQILENKTTSFKREQFINEDAKIEAQKSNPRNMIANMAKYMRS